MAHLDADVAAFVDGQLSPDATEAAARHVQDCAACREAVAQQRHLKLRMKASADVRPPASLVASLATLPQAPPPPPPGFWSRVLRSSAWSAAGVLAGAALVVVAAAYVAGGSDRPPGDAVLPPVDAYAAEFREPVEAAVAGEPSSGGVMTAAVMAELTANGWPCHGRLGDDLERVEGRLQDHGSVSLTYTDGWHRLELHEQTGVLDHARLEGFARREVADRPVWVREGRTERVVVWDADGVVYTIVTDVADDRLALVLRDLPAPREEPDADERVARGLQRVSGWFGG